jgi:hypothetical protein
MLIVEATALRGFSFTPLPKTASPASKAGVIVRCTSSDAARPKRKRPRGMTARPFFLQ